MRRLFYSIRCLFLALTGCGALGAPAISTFPYAVNFDGGQWPPGWTNAVNDSGYDWQLSQSGIDEPDYDHTTGTGYYIVVDSWYYPQTNTIVYLPAFDVSALANPALSFWYWVGNDTVYLEALRTNTWVVLGSWSGWNHYWREARANLAADKSTNLQLRLRGNIPGSYRFCICVDDLTVFDDIAPPEAPARRQPAPNATNVPLFATLRWEERANVSHYRLYVGTDGNGGSTPTNLVNGRVLPGGASRAALDNLAPNTDYYWQLVPSNSLGEAASVPIHRFTTGARATISAFPWTENFERNGNLPPGWISGYDATGTGWVMVKSGSQAVWGDHTSGAGWFANVDTQYQSPVTALTNSLLTPVLAVANMNYPKLSFWFAKGGEPNSYQSHVRVRVFHHGAWEAADLLAHTTETPGWTNRVLDLTPYRADDLRVAFLGVERGYYLSDIALDDVSLYDDTNPPSPVTLISPAHNTNGAPPRGLLVWQPAERADNYRLFMGTDGGGVSLPTNLINGLALGNVSSFNYSNLAYATKYYWSIVPFNLIGQASNNPVRAFTTYAAPPSFAFL